jgi:hypothetical protein
MEHINNTTATPLYPTQPSLAPNVTVLRDAPVSGIGRGQHSVFSTTGQMGAVQTADQGLGSAVVRVRATKQAAPPRGVPR